MARARCALLHGRPQAVARPTVGESAGDRRDGSQKPRSQAFKLAGLGDEPEFGFQLLGLKPHVSESQPDNEAGG